MEVNGHEKLVISVVSHGHGEQLKMLLNSLREHCVTDTITFVLTINIPEKLPFDVQQYDFIDQVIYNETPKGYGANHNAAFKRTEGDFFCVLNPDIIFIQDPFQGLIRALKSLDTGIVAPVVTNVSGDIEDSARRFITPTRIAKRTFKRFLNATPNPDYLINDTIVYPDWIAGMFLLFRSKVFAQLGGFDEDYFMYCEDADICIRMKRAGYNVSVIPAVSVVHDARRDSHKQLKHMCWHLNSLARFYLSHRGWRFSSD